MKYELSWRQHNNQSYAHCDTGRFEMCIATLRQLKQLLSDVTNESEDEQVVFASYLSQIIELLICCELLSLHWHRYADHLHEALASRAYVTPSIQSPISHQGRPKLEITRDQLLYLASLSLSWTCSANMLGVSRMTI